MRRADPIAPVAYGVALVLADGPLHPYGIVEAVGSLDVGFHTSRATVYRVVERMSARGWITQVTAPSDADPRRRCYKLTDAGRAAVRAETQRMRFLADLAETRGLS